MTPTQTATKTPTLYVDLAYKEGRGGPGSDTAVFGPFTDRAAAERVLARRAEDLDVAQATIREEA